MQVDVVGEYEKPSLIKGLAMDTAFLKPTVCECPLDTEAYKAGMRDRMCFHAILSNPYKRGSLEWLDWRRGWAVRDTEHFMRVP